MLKTIPHGVDSSTFLGSSIAPEIRYDAPIILVLCSFEQEQSISTHHAPDSSRARREADRCCRGYVQGTVQHRGLNAKSNSLQSGNAPDVSAQFEEFSETVRLVVPRPRLL